MRNNGQDFKAGKEAVSSRTLILISSICAASHSLDAQTPEPGKPTPEPGKQKEFIYVPRLVPRLYDGERGRKRIRHVGSTLPSITRSDKIRLVDSGWTHKRAG
jgi:hypothetical protein